MYFPLYDNFGPLLSLNQQCSDKMAWFMFSCYPTISIREPSSEKMCPLVVPPRPGLQNEPKSRKIRKKTSFFFQQNGYNQKKWYLTKNPINRLALWPGRVCLYFDIGRRDILEFWPGPTTPRPLAFEFNNSLTILSFYYTYIFKYSSSKCNCIELFHYTNQTTQIDR